MYLILYCLIWALTQPGGWTDNLNGTLDACGQYRGFEGIYLLNELLEYGWLESDGVTATQALTRGWDDCAKQVKDFPSRFGYGNKN
jgi:hypothetical protein